MKAFIRNSAKAGVFLEIFSPAKAGGNLKADNGSSSRFHRMNVKLLSFRQ